MGIFPYSTGVQNALLIHGMTSKAEHLAVEFQTPSNSHWFPWLSKQLLMRSIYTTAIEMPNAYAPVYNSWCTEFERYKITPNTLLVGHSCGAGFLLRWLAEHPQTSGGKIVLVAPWLDPFNTLTSDPTFFDYNIAALSPAHAAKATIFHSLNDDKDICMSVDTIRSAFPAMQYKEFTAHGHFCLADMHTIEFPELLEHILS